MIVAGSRMRWFSMILMMMLIVMGMVVMMMSAHDRSQ
jgi:hypothetical protein